MEEVHSLELTHSSGEFRVWVAGSLYSQHQSRTDAEESMENARQRLREGGPVYTVDGPV